VPWRPFKKISPKRWRISKTLGYGWLESLGPGHLKTAIPGKYFRWMAGRVKLDAREHLRENKESWSRKNSQVRGPRVELRIPARLKKEPLLEAVWEIRFDAVKAPIADLLPGILYKTFAGKFSSVTRLPFADLPAVAFEHDPNLRYAPKIRLEVGNQAVQIGEHMVSLNCRRPYSGWAQFYRDITELAKVV
jgi:hypothetical protein